MSTCFGGGAALFATNGATSTSAWHRNNFGQPARLYGHSAMLAFAGLALARRAMSRWPWLRSCRTFPHGRRPAPDSFRLSGINPFYRLKLFIAHDHHQDRLLVR
jgi:hypothetical protein